MERGAKTLDVKRVLAAAKLIRRLRSVMLSGNWEWVGGVLADARVMRDTLPVPCLKELQVCNPFHRTIPTYRIPPLTPLHPCCCVSFWAGLGWLQPPAAS